MTGRMPAVSYDILCLPLQSNTGKIHYLLEQYSAHSMISNVFMTIL